MHFTDDFVNATATTTRKWMPKHGHFANFIPRDKMAKRHNARMFAMQSGIHVPATSLPIDGTANATVSCPMYGNDHYGCCGEAMAAHTDGILTFSQGQRPENIFPEAALIKQYLATSGGDNGMDETMLVGPGGVWMTGIGGDPAAVVVDSLDVPSDPNILRYCIDQFYAVEMAWSVPDAFISQFQNGASFLSPMTPNPHNGHYVTVADVDASGNSRMWTWGGWCWVSDSFIASVQPVFFVVFSARQFDLRTGLDGKNRHVTTQAAKWQAMGGKTVPGSVIASFPPIGGPPLVQPPVAGGNVLTLTSSIQPGTYALPVGSLSVVQAIQPGAYTLTPEGLPTPPVPIPPVPVASGPTLANVLSLNDAAFRLMTQQLPPRLTLLMGQINARSDAAISSGFSSVRQSVLAPVDPTWDKIVAEARVLLETAAAPATPAGPAK